MMTKRMVLCILLALTLLMSAAIPAMAADSLSLTAKSEGEAGSAHKISWECTGDAPASYVMRLYYEGKLIARSNLSGAATSATIAGSSLSKAGAYSVKLFAMETDNSYIESEVSFTLTGAKEQKACQTAEPACATEQPVCPTAKPVCSTQAPIITQAPSATAKPTQAASPMPTQAATARPTAAPTVKPTQTAAPSGSSMTEMAEEVVRQTNSDRAKNGLGALTVDADLTRAACIRAQEIVEKFSHERPDGSRALSVSSKAKGENIAKGQQTADKVMAAWMSSDGHRANILRSSFKTIGVCAYKVNGIMYWVQLFGN